MRRWLTITAAAAAVMLALVGGGANGAAVDPTGCGANDLGRGDDISSPAVPLSFPVNFFGTMYSSLYVNNNGNVTFDAPLADYTPQGMPNLHRPLIAPFFADVDTRNPSSGTVHYGETKVGDARALCVLWDDVGFYNTHAHKTNRFQLLLVERPDKAPGDFDVVLNYDRLEWETGDADSGVDGLGGLAAEVGLTNADNHFTLAGSQTSGTFLDASPAGLVHGSFNGGDIAGRYVFRIRGGSPGLGNPVSGQVHAGDGSAVPDALLRLCPTGGSGEACLTTRSRPDGSYMFADVLDGTWDLVGFPPQGTSTASGTLTGIQTSGAPVSGADLTLPDTPPAPAAPNGAVQTAAGDPIAGAIVTVLAAATPAGSFVPVADGSSLLAPGLRSNPATTGADGAFAFDALAGFYKLQAFKPGCHAAGDQTIDYAESPLLELPPAPSQLVLALDCPAPPADTTPPLITVPDTITAAATSAAGANVSFDVSATDDVDGPVPVSCDKQSGALFPVGTTTVHCTASDAAGNSANSQFDVVVTPLPPADATPPVIDVPAQLSTEATSAAGATVTYSVSATDAVDGPVPVACDKQSGSVFPLGTTTVHCSATDKAGNEGTAQFDVVVSDTTAPALDLPATIHVDATSAAGAQVGYAVSASDLVDGTVPVGCDKQSGSLFPVGTTTVHCSASDQAGNTAHGSFDVVVAPLPPPVDTTPPVLELPAAVTAEASSAAGAAVLFSVSATDDVDGTVPVDCDKQSGSMFPLGKTTVHCSATDKAGNNASGGFDVVVSDTTAPALALPGTITKEATSAAGTDVSFTVSASDLVDGPVPVSCDAKSGSLFQVGATTVHCSAADGHGNTGHGSFEVVVSDTTAPALELPVPITKEATSPAGAVVMYTASASDLVDGPVTVGCSKPSGSTFPVGKTTVDCVATDAHHNTATGTFDVVVSDTTAPALDLPATVNVQASSQAGAIVSFQATAFDLVDGNVPVGCDMQTGSLFPVGTTTVQCSAKDAAENEATGQFDVVVGPPAPVSDTTPPVLSLPAAIVVNATAPGGAVVSYVASALDAVDGNVPVSCSKPSGTLFPIGTTTVACSATDATGNQATGQFTVKVLGAKEQLEALLAEVIRQKLGPGSSLQTKLRDAIAALQPLTPTASCIYLGQLESLVDAQTGKKLTADQAAWLRSEVARIKRVLGC